MTRIGYIRVSSKERSLTKVAKSEYTKDSKNPQKRLTYFKVCLNVEEMRKVRRGEE